MSVHLFERRKNARRQKKEYWLVDLTGKNGSRIVVALDGRDYLANDKGNLIVFSTEGNAGSFLKADGLDYEGLVCLQNDEFWRKVSGLMGHINIDPQS